MLESEDERNFESFTDEQKRKIYCANCGEKGHVYKTCTGPITSFGIIAFKLVESREDEILDLNMSLRQVLEKAADKKLTYSSLFSSLYPTIKFLLIQRKDTMGYIDFIRGKYPEDDINKRLQLEVYMSEMTFEERKSLEQKTFDELWDDLWISKTSRTYRKEYDQAKRKFNTLNIKELLRTTTSTWSFQEFGLPKGRRNMKETNIACAEREFGEETGYSKQDYSFLSGYPTVEEDFIGTNGVHYKHVYYVVKMKSSSVPPKIDMDNDIQRGEVQNIGWFTIDQCLAVLRPYDNVKKQVLRKVHDDLKNMRTFSCSDYYYRKRRE